MDGHSLFSNMNCKITCEECVDAKCSCNLINWESMEHTFQDSNNLRQMHNFQDSKFLRRMHNFQDSNILHRTHTFQDSNILHQMQVNFSVGKFSRLEYFPEHHLITRLNASKL
jgi:hypothetical protein